MLFFIRHWNVFTIISILSYYNHPLFNFIIFIIQFIIAFFNRNLSDMDLSGSMGYQLANLKSVTYLWGPTYSYQIILPFHFSFFIYIPTTSLKCHAFIFHSAVIWAKTISTQIYPINSLQMLVPCKRFLFYILHFIATVSPISFILLSHYAEIFLTINSKDLYLIPFLRWRISNLCNQNSILFFFLFSSFSVFFFFSFFFYFILCVQISCT